MPPKTSGKAAKKAGKAQKAIAKGDKKKKRRRKESYSIYIYGREFLTEAAALFFRSTLDSELNQ